MGLWSKGQPKAPRSRALTLGGRAFTLIELLVSISIIALLISIMLPAFSKLTETSRRVACQSNLRQIGTAVLMYADEYGGWLPPSAFVMPSSRGEKQAHEMNMLRFESAAQGLAGLTPWDGLGVLYTLDFLPAQPIFYCPSHKGSESLRVFRDAWDSDVGLIRGNYHYRGEGPAGETLLPNGQLPMTRQLASIDPAQSSLLADSLRTLSMPNHTQGSNFFRADLTVHWYTSLGSPSVVDGDSIATPSDVDQAWRNFDASASTPRAVQPR